MLLKVIGSTGFRYIPLRIFHCSSKRCSKFLTFLTVSQFSRSCKNFCTNTSPHIFDDVYVQKYLKYMLSELLTKNNRFKETVELQNLLDKKQELEIELTNLETMRSEGDKELEKLIEAERKYYLESIEEIKNEIVNFISPKDDDDDDRHVELKIIPGIGGEEAKLFSAELFQMYLSYAELKNWQCFGDYRDGFIIISGKSVYGHLKHEAGVHRVQRVPVTETSGRIQSSTCSVVILPQPKPHEIQILEKDIIVEKLKSSGPGGQNVNKRETCIRIRHVPTGITIESQTQRFQHSNLKDAINRLRGILFNREKQELLLERKSHIKEQAGSNDYSDKIRTYNFTQSRVTDHRINYSVYNIRGFLSGGKALDTVIEHMRTTALKKNLLTQVQSTLDSEDYKIYAKKQA